ncbi:MAG: hypothetical protein PHC85_03215, partial [Candidatus Pacebacteria bacterium]|nr:hypothetical protein [Candidatus Paceibacterota bacterium]
STSEAKKDIASLNEEDYEKALEKITETDLAAYRYREESESDPLRVGLIAENSPKEVLSATGDGVDIYKMVSYAWAGIKAQQEKIDKMELRMGELEGLVASLGGGGEMSGTGPFLEQITGLFKNAYSLVIENGLLKITQIISDKITTKEFCIEDVCMTKEQLKLLLEKNNISPVLGTETQTETKIETEIILEEPAVEEPASPAEPAPGEPEEEILAEEILPTVEQSLPEEAAPEQPAAE